MLSACLPSPRTHVEPRLVVARSDCSGQTCRKPPFADSSKWRTRAYANVGYPVGQCERRVSGKTIGSGKTRSRPVADRSASWRVRQECSGCGHSLLSP